MQIALVNEGESVRIQKLFTALNVLTVLDVFKTNLTSMDFAQACWITLVFHIFGHTKRRITTEKNSMRNVAAVSSSLFPLHMDLCTIIILIGMG
jgi:predicted secreted Zn-dependent protease